MDMKDKREKKIKLKAGREKAKTEVHKEINNPKSQRKLLNTPWSHYRLINK